jgi:hypothetical protein
MLRITRLAPDAGIPCLRVEGRLVGDWVDVLDSEVSISEGPKLTLELSGVEFADARALSLLQRLSRHGVELVACSPLLSSLLKASDS